METKQVNRLFSQSFITYIASYIGAGLAFYIFSDIAADISYVKNWFYLFSILTLLRISTALIFKKADYIFNIETWLFIFIFFSFISGLMWGITGFIFISDSMSLLDSVLYHGVLLLLISTLIAGSIITYSSKIIVYLSFSIPAIIPQCLILISIGDKYHTFLGGVCILYTFIMFIMSLYMHRIYDECHKIESSNTILRSTLRANGIIPG